MKKKQYFHQEDEQLFQHEFFETSSETDHMLKDIGNPPEGYPRHFIQDTYAKTPFQSIYEKRRDALFEHCLKNPSRENIKGYFFEMVRLYKEKEPVHEGMINSALKFINERYDVSDFVMLGIIRMLYQLQRSKLLKKEQIAHAKQTLLNYKYWPDEPGIDSMCYWTENHVIIFSSNEYLAGQMFPDKVFSNSGMIGYEKMIHARKIILKWLELRFKTGFSEWLSNIYYDADITALINLVDFSNDPLIVRGAEIVLDLIFYDMALNSFYGAFGSTHGRSYANEKRSALIESTIDTEKLMFGMGIYAGADNMSAISLALSNKYRLPRVIYEIANDYKREELINRQRMGIKIKEAKRWGLNFKDFDSGITFLTLEAYVHPKTFKLTFKMFDAFRWWENQQFGSFNQNKTFINILRFTGLYKLVTIILKKDLCRNTREEVNIYTYKSPDFMLSSAQDYRKGYGGDQQHIWQSTLSPEAVCFTTHPGCHENISAGYWLGSGTLPRVAQIKNLVIAVYKISRMPGIYKTNKLFFTHAWFPRDKFDEVVEKNGWIFGRKDDGYIALYPRNGYKWQLEGEDKKCEIISDGIKNIWICEMGRKVSDGNFNEFVKKIVEAKLLFKRTKVIYYSPSQGRINFGWRGPLKQNGNKVKLHNYSRYNNPYSQAHFPPEEITIECGNHSLKLNLKKGIRNSSDYVK